MAIATEFVLIDSRGQAAAPCIVCGSEIGPDEGITATFGGRTLRFKCDGCLSRFQADPDRYLAGPAGGCCGGAHDHSPASEWSG